MHTGKLALLSDLICCTDLMQEHRILAPEHFPHKALIRPELCRHQIGARIAFGRGPAWAIMDTLRGNNFNNIGVIATETSSTLSTFTVHYCIEVG